MVKRATKGIRLGAVCEALGRIAPLELAAPWDNVGLLCGDLRASVARALVCIDLMPDVADEAVRRRCDLVIAYHPPIFQPIKRLVAPGDGMDAPVLRCLSKGIAIYSLHTALDAAVGGTNDVLVGLCGGVDAKPLQPAVGSPEGTGQGRIARLERPAALGKLAKTLSRRTGARQVAIVGDRDREIRRVVVVVGAAGSLPFEAGLGRHDAIVTGEIRHHDALRIVRAGASGVALSHWSSERPALGPLAERIGVELPGLEVQISEADREPFTPA